MPERCAACGSAGLRPHLAVGGELGSDGLIPTTDAFGGALGDIVRCPACGHMQLDRMPAEPELAEAYAGAESETYLAEEAGQRETARRALARIERHVERGAILDLGCWVGFLLAEARSRGWEAKGVEPSAWASDHARDRLGLDVVTGGLLDAELERSSFEAVVLGDVIEHLPDPGAALDRVAGLLVPDGVLWMALPDAGSRVARAMGARWWSVIPTHVQYFTRASMVTLLERRGWTVLELATAPKTFTISYYLERVGGYSRTAAKALVTAATRAGIAERMWAPDFRDRMEVVARAPA